MAPHGDRPSREVVVPVERSGGEIVVLPPDSGFLGDFLNEVHNMFRARAMRMKGLLGRINESGQRTEALLRMAAELMETAEAHLEDDLRKQGLGPGSQ